MPVGEHIPEKSLPITRATVLLVWGLEKGKIKAPEIAIQARSCAPVLNSETQHLEKYLVESSGSRRLLNLDRYMSLFKTCLDALKDFFGRLSKG